MVDAHGVKLFCLPHAGGAGSLYEAWRPLLSPALEVTPIELPGRGRRLRERALLDFDELIEDVIAGILPLLDSPFALLGHSMGAVLAFECARVLSAAQGCSPLALVVSGHRAPQLPPRPRPAMHELDDAGFLARAREFSSDLNDALEYEELRELFLPVLRSDLTAMEAYVYRPGEPLACDILALGGTDDPHVSEEELAGWAEQTKAGFHMRLFAGNHFFIHHAAKQVVTEVGESLASSIAGLAWGSA
jgi:surfactin synthase thioesterase subunit